MGLDIYFYEIDEQDYKRNDDDVTITVLSSKSMWELAYYSKWSDLSDFIREIWLTNTHGYLDYNDYNSANVLLVHSDIDSLEEFAKDYEDEDVDLNVKPDMYYIWFNYSENIMYLTVWVDEDEILDNLSGEPKEQIAWEANLKLLEQLHYIHEMQGKEAMLTKLEFLMNDYKLPYIRLTPWITISYIP